MIGMHLVIGENTSFDYYLLGCSCRLLVIGHILDTMRMRRSLICPLSLRAGVGNSTAIMTTAVSLILSGIYFRFHFNIAVHHLKERKNQR